MVVSESETRRGSLIFNYSLYFTTTLCVHLNFTQGWSHTYLRSYIASRMYIHEMQLFNGMKQSVVSKRRFGYRFALILLTRNTIKFTCSCVPSSSSQSSYKVDLRFTSPQLKNMNKLVGNSRPAYVTVTSCRMGY